MRRRRFPIRGLVLVASSVVALAACTGAATPSPSASVAPSVSSPPAESDAPSASADPAAALDAVCEAGAVEGTAVLWSNFANPDPIFAAFNEQYPDIEVELLLEHPDDHAQRVLTELTAGRAPTPDVVYGELSVLDPLIDIDAFDSTIDWQSLGVPEDLVPSTANVVRLDRVANGIVYNTNNHSADILPDTWEELIDPQWEQQIVVDPRGRPFDQLSLVWGHDETIDYVRQLNDLSPLVIRGGTAGMLAVASEQAAITTGGRSAETFEQQDAGAPLEIKYLDVIPTIDGYNGVLAEAAHPNAATCVVAWLAVEGQEVHFEAEFKTNDTVPLGAPEDAEFVSIETPEDAEAVAAIGEEIGAIFGGTGG